jgi:hypothetical protein
VEHRLMHTVKGKSMYDIISPASYS